MGQIDLSGTGVALITPFKNDLGVDFEALAQVVEHVINGGVDYLVVMGTTGESVTVNNEEKKQIIDFIVSKNNSRLPIVLGIGGNNTQSVVETIKTMDLSAFAAILSVSPYYNKPNQEGIYQHYKMIAKSTDKPIILYNVPGRTGKNISAKTTLRLAKNFENIIAIKEASGDMTQIMKVLNEKPKNFKVISGDDAMTFPMMTLGSKGVISVVANAYPSQYAQMVNLLNKGETEKARELHYLLFDMIGLLFEDGSPSGVKSLLKAMGICGDAVRLPLVPTTKDLAEKIKKEMKAIG